MTVDAAPNAFALRGIASSAVSVPALLAQCIWLGEVHTPLASIPPLLDRVARGAQALLALLYIPSVLRTRFQHELRDAVRALHDTPSAALDTIPPHEADAMRAAVAYGPFAHAANARGIDAALPPFLHAIQIRSSIQVELIVVCYLLREARNETILGPTSPHKSKRKSAKAQRWLGPALATPLVFPWAAQVPPPLPASPPRTPTLAPASLHALYETLADQLCLLQITSEAYGPPLYGSAARVMARDDARDDARDEAQWVCAEIIEPFYKSRLPNECAQLRAKCFGPGQQPTPQRRQKRATSARKPDVQRAQRSCTDTATTIRADKKQREVHMHRALRRTTSMCSAPLRARAPLAARSRPAQRSEAETLVCATPEQKRHTSVPPGVFGTPSLSPEGSPSQQRGAPPMLEISSDEELVIPREKAADLRRGLPFLMGR
ncbi:hypothetical protein MVES1_000167 [Malassezia vespertilionis]|uniref:DNA replication regulator Sld3 C-terminal domain-containing protein n=1 Tax=Malassezia vespertilionis TaxID=2020962 RepID=A0A2N1JHB0_9BASI|nr:uncharacterized protein MVES1_000167 [Malassezia vespertilionis]PKI85934.1 hypothetical protein MVES_000163 [Malassezia vespertilionis]WFD04843.1 hypothetical protein MVES1_000167 [Malassezia vespertilionis]